MSKAEDFEDYKLLLKNRYLLKMYYDNRVEELQEAGHFAKIQPMVTTLVRFCQANPLPKTTEWQTLSTRIRASQYMPICEAVISQYLGVDDYKKGTIVVAGVKDSGKTTILDYIKKIFKTATESLDKGFSIAQRADITGTQIVVFNELCKELFDKSQLSNTKELFERRGWKVAPKH
jgi:hypothetical protein